MAFYRRRLPHLYSIGQPVFLTWRLYGTVPRNRFFPDHTLSSGKAFIALDRILDEARTGPSYLRFPAVADMVVDSIHYQASVLRHYVLHAYVVVPNHVHLLATPYVPLPKLTKALKGLTGTRANEILGLTGKAFWQQESYDRLVRNPARAADDEAHRRVSERAVRSTGLRVADQRAEAVLRSGDA